MAKVHILEVIRVAMTVTAAAGVVICRRLVTSRTIRIANCTVVKPGILEVVRVLMTVAARPRIMVWRRLVAG
jgi:hypothetical protein